MSKLARALALAAILAAAMNLASMTAVAQAHASDSASQRHRAPGRSEFFAAHEHAVASREQSSRDDDTLERRLAEDHHYSGTWREDIPAAPAAAEPGGQPGWLIPALGGLAVALALVAGGAVVVARRASRSQRAAKPA
jgi:hypothetical protein